MPKKLSSVEGQEPECLQAWWRDIWQQRHCCERREAQRKHRGARRKRRQGVLSFGRLAAPRRWLDDEKV